MLELIAVWLGRLLFKVRWIDFAPDGGWCDRPAFRWDFDGFLTSQQALEQARSAKRRSRAVLLGEARATIDVASEAVRQMSGSRREREARPSCETVHHIVKAEIHAEVSALKTEVNDKVDALDAKVGALDTKVDALQVEMSSMNDKLDRLLSSMIHA